jgi:hypothetical protein
MSTAQRNNKGRKPANVQTTQTVQPTDNRRGFLRTLGLGVVAAGLGVETLTKLTGCGDTTNITNNYGPDGGPKPDTIDPCEKDKSNKCEEKGNAVNCVLNKGKSVEKDGLVFTYKERRKIDGKDQYLFDVYDKDVSMCEPVIKDHPVTLDVNPEPPAIDYVGRDLVTVYDRGYVITVNSELPPTQEDKTSDYAVNVSIERVNGQVVPYTEMNNGRYGLLNQGEGFPLELYGKQFNVIFTDHDTVHDAVGVKIKDMNGNTLDQYPLPNNSFNSVRNPAAPFEKMIVEVRHSITGYTFGTKSTKITVYTQ